MKSLPSIVQTPSDAGKNFHAEILLPDFFMNYNSSAKRAAYTRNFRVVKTLARFFTAENGHLGRFGSNRLSYVLGCNRGNVRTCSFLSLFFVGDLLLRIVRT